MVMFKVQDPGKASEKQQIIKEIKNRLEALTINIPEIKFFNIGVNINDSTNGFDLILESEFDSMQALEIYRRHPEHQKFVDFFKQYKEQSASVDYEV